MQTQYISFCGKLGLNIKKNETKQSILDDLDEIKIIDIHHEKFNKDRHVHRLQKVPHLVGIKSNGNPYYMFLTRLNLVNTVIMIDKKVQMGYSLPRMIIVWVNFSDDSLFDNTLLEGEMICDKNNDWLFLISDLRMLRNNSTNQMDLCNRMNCVHDIFDKFFQPSFQDLFAIQIKKYVHTTEVMKLHDEFIPSLPYTCRGLYLKPLYAKFKDILINFDDSLVTSTKRESYKNTSHFLTSTDEVKATPPKRTVDHVVEIECSVELGGKESSHNVRNLYVQKTTVPDVYMLYDITTKKEVGKACVDTLATSKMLTGHFATLSMLVKSTFRCEHTSNSNLNNVWIPKQFLPNP